MFKEWNHRELDDLRDDDISPENDLQKIALSDISALVVREFIQNALDNKSEREEVSDKPVIVCINIVDQPESVNKYFGALKKHIAMNLYNDNDEQTEGVKDEQWKDLRRQINAYAKVEGKKKRRQIPYSKPRNIESINELFKLNQKCMILEDYNTTGLSGDISNNPKLRKVGKPKFRNFVFNDGRTTTSSRSLGSHGSGRKSMLYASCIQSILVYTKRENEKEEREEVVAGISFTQARQDKEDNEYMPESHFVKEYPDNGKQRVRGYINADTENIVEDVKRTFKLRKAKDIEEIKGNIGKEDSGLSVVVPFPDVGLNTENIQLDILVNCALAIYADKLIIVQHDIKEGSTYVYHKQSIKRIMKDVIESRREKKQSDKVRIIQYLYEILEEIEEKRLRLDSPDVELTLEKDFRGRVRDEFRKKIEKEGKVESMREKYKRLKAIHVHVERMISYKDPKKKDRRGHYRLYLKKTDYEGESLLMRGFIIYLDENKRNRNKRYNKYLALTIAISEEKGEDNPYFELLRDCEGMNHRKIYERKLERTDVLKPSSYINQFKNAEEIGDYLDRLNFEEADYGIEDPLFPYREKEDKPVNPRRKRKKLLDLKMDGSSNKKFIITATEFLKNKLAGEEEIIKVRVGVYYAKSSGVRSEALESVYFPKFKIDRKRNKEDKIEKIDDEDEAKKIVRVSSTDFHITGIINDNTDDEYVIKYGIIGEDE